MRLIAINKFINRKSLFSLIYLFLGTTLWGQQTDNTILSIERNKTDNTPTSISFSPAAKWKDDQAMEIFQKYLGSDGTNTTWQLNYNTTTKSKTTVKRYNEYYKGIKVEYGSYSLTCKDGLVTFITGNYYNIDPSVVTTATLSEGDAFTKALTFVGAKKYMWEEPAEEKRIQQMFHKADTTFKPRGILTYIEDFSNGMTSDRKLHLAYAFDIYARSPLSRQIVYVDAGTGKVLYSNSMIKNTAASGHTLYSGNVPFVTSRVAGTYELFDSTRGTGVHTLNMNYGTDFTMATEYTSFANTWPTSIDDTQALDAHWAAEMVYDYWKVVQGRLSYDNSDGQLNQYVHYDVAFDNAFWDGFEMSYGDGSGCAFGGFTPLVSLDITAHEIGHGVCQYTANLVYAGESGALNEGFSDCWGATIENYANPHETDAVAKQIWSIGEEVSCGTPMRRMDNPNITNLPDTYGGTYWYTVSGCVPSGFNDECGVHTNSSILNKWYYLVTNGGSGTNDLSNSYSVTGIGFTEAANILYQTELVLSSTADYALTRTTSINTATTLYGACSPEVIAVTNAWYAVGVGAAYVAYPANITGPTTVCVGSTITLSDATPSGSWSSRFPAIATAGFTGSVLGVSPGVDTIIYSVGTGCNAKHVVTVNAAPTATVSPAPTATLCAGGSVTLNASTGTGYTYQWQSSGFPVAGATNATYTTSATGSYAVQITGSTGCSATSLATTVNVVPLPTATITPSSSTTFCPGGSVVLNANPGAGYTYQWQVAGGPITGATSISYTATAGGNYTVVVTNASGCSATSAVTTVSVNPAPSAITGTASVCSGLTTTLNSTPAGGSWSSSDLSVATVSGSGVVTGIGTGGLATITYTLLTGCYTTVVVTVNTNTAAPITGPTSVCFGQTISLADATTGGSWTSTDPFVAPITSSGVVTGAGTGTATISYTVTTLCGIATATSAINVNPLPTIASITGTTSVCNGGSVLLSDATLSGVWTSNNTAVATVGSTSGVTTGVSLGSAGISYTVTNAFGCSASATTTMNVFSAFAASVTAAGPTSVCLGGTVLLNATTGSGYNYQWYNYGTPLSAATSSSYLATATGSYTVLISEASGCHTLSSNIPVNVSPTPLVPPTVSISASPGFQMCLTPSPVTFTAIPTYGGATPSYQWLVNGSVVGGSSTYTYTPAGGDIIKCILTSSYACASPLTASHTDTMILIPSMLTPAVSIAPNMSPICSGDTIIFAAVPVYGGSAPTYLWTKNGINVATGPHYHYLPSNGDHLVVTMTSNQACASPTVVSSSVFTVPVTNHVTNSIVVSVSQSTIASGSVDTFTAVAINGGSSPSFHWLRNGVLIPGATAPVYVTSTLANGDVISCMETSNAPCAEPATVISSGIRVNVNAVDVKQVSNGSLALTLQPNPNRGEFTIEGSLDANTPDDNINIQVTDMLGQIIYSDAAASHNGTINKRVTLNGSIASGIYLVTVTSGKNHIIFHMILNK